MLLSELLKGLNVIKSNVKEETEIKSICSDSRELSENAAFICISGTSFDGHSVIPQIKDRVEVFIVERELECEVPFVLVEDTRLALSVMFANFYGNPQRRFKKMIGITGTNGKTSTAYMIREIFENAGYKTGMLGTVKYLIGNEEFEIDKSKAVLTTPDPKLLFEMLKEMADRGVECVVMEVSSHSLELKKVAPIEFDVAVFTNLTQDHLDFHKDIESYKNAKALLFKQSKIGIFNIDDASAVSIMDNAPCKIFSYSTNKNEADYVTKNIKYIGAKRIEYELLTSGLIFRVKLPVPGRFSIYNSLAAASCALICGIEASKIQEALETFEGVPGRIERVMIDADFSVFIDFAHTPDALENVLKSANEFALGRVVALFGCGGDRDRTKRPIMCDIALKNSDFVIITSDNSRTEEKAEIIKDILKGVKDNKTPYTVIENRTEAIKYALDNAKKDDVIILAGKGHEEYEIDKTGKHPYSEKQIVIDYFSKKGN